MAKKKSSSTHRPSPSTKAVTVTEPVPPNPNGMELAVPMTMDLNTRISLEVGIDNMVAIGIVYTKDLLGPQLEQEVAEIHRLGNEVSRRNADLVAIYNNAPIDPAYEKKCQAAIAAMEAVGVKLTLEMTKTGFNSETLKYNLMTRFRGDTTTTRDYTITDKTAEKLCSEVVQLRQQQSLHSKAAEVTKRHLNKEWLDERLRATIAENAMNQTASGADAIRAMLAGLNKVLKVVAPPQPQLQLEKD